MQSNLIQFLKTGIWRIRASKLHRSRSFGLNLLRIFILGAQEFHKDKCQLRASALTFYSLLSVVPIAAMAFGVAKGFGIEKNLEKLLYEKLPGQEEAVRMIVNFAQSFLEKTKGGMIAGIGIAFLFFLVIKVLGNIEHSFNDIWEVKKPRSIVRKVSDYLSLMFICPTMLIVSSSVTVLFTSEITLFTKKIALLGFFSPIIFVILELIPYFFIWILLTFIYIFMPNTKVKFIPGLWGGVIAGTIYQVVQWAYITFQIEISRFGAIYGSLAALPLFLFWLQVSWLIVLFGAEISFATQNVESYEFEPDCQNLSHSFKRLLAVRIAHLCVINFSTSKTPWTAKQIAHYLEAPIRLVEQLLFELTESGILSKVELDANDDIAYQPAHDINELTINDVVKSLDKRGVDGIPIAKSEEMEALSKRLDALNKTVEMATSNVMLKDL